MPFYVAAPLTSVDMSLTSGDRIKIEERPDREMTHIGEHRIAAPGMHLIMFISFAHWLSRAIRETAIYHHYLTQLNIPLMITNIHNDKFEVDNNPLCLLLRGLAVKRKIDSQRIIPRKNIFYLPELKNHIIILVL